MADLIHALIQVKDTLTLLAFLSIVLLLAFRTKRVPDLLYLLAQEKLTKERFSSLVHRFLLFGFAGFVLVCTTAVIGQVLASKTQAQPLTLGDLKSELKNSKAEEERKLEAQKSYAEALALIERKSLTEAIAALQRSIEQVPSLAAQYTLAYVYQKAGDKANATKYAVAAQSQASLNGDSVALVRLNRLNLGENAASGALIGQKSPLPLSGRSFEEAPEIRTGLYVCTEYLNGNEYRYLKLRLKRGATVRIDYRTVDGDGANAGAAVYNANGELQSGPATSHAMGRSVPGKAEWTSDVDQWIYIGIGGSYGTNAGTVYRISVM